MSGLGSDPVFGALTRPQMVAGVTYSYAVFNLIVTVEAFLITKSFWALLIAPAVHVANFQNGTYVTFAADRSLRFRVFQVHSPRGDRAGWPPPPSLTAVFFA